LSTRLGAFDRRGDGIARRSPRGERALALRPFDRFALQAGIATFEALARRGRLLCLQLVLPEHRLGLAETMYKRDLAGARQVAASAFAAVEQAMVDGLRPIVGAQVEQQLLRLQPRRTNRRAVAAANAGHLEAAHLRNLTMDRFSGR
jgi:hypothetical protein